MAPGAFPSVPRRVECKTTDRVEQGYSVRYASQAKGPSRARRGTPCTVVLGSRPVTSTRSNRSNAGAGTSIATTNLYAILRRR
jgi:hypothetical protein